MLSVYQELFNSDCGELLQQLTKECLELLSFEIARLVSKQLADQLPGGLYHSPSPSVVSETASCPTTNKVSEKDFSDLDRLVNRAPQKSTLHVSANVTFRNNGTADYLASLPHDKRLRIFQKAQVLTQIRQKRKRERVNQIRKERQRMMEENKAKKERKRLKDTETNNKLRQRVKDLGGVWRVQSLADIDEKLDSLHLSGAAVCRQALKDQIQYLGMTKKAKRELTAFSKGGKQLTILELKRNLLALSSALGTLPSVSMDIVAEKNTITVRHGLRPAGERSALITCRTQSTGQVGKQDKRVKATKRQAASERSDQQKKKKLCPASPISPPVNSYVDNMLGKFLCVAYEDTWYLGEVLSIKSDSEAEIKYLKRFGGKYFSWPDIEDVKSTTSVFVIGGPHSIKPRDSSLRYFILEDLKQPPYSRLMNHLENV